MGWKQARQSVLSWFDHQLQKAGHGLHRDQQQLADAMHGEAELCCGVMRLLQKGVLILDEVDLILHPLKSELNWPLGGKARLRRALCLTAQGCPAATVLRLGRRWFMSIDGREAGAGGMGHVLLLHSGP